MRLIVVYWGQPDGGLLISGSFNFTENATLNAENLLMVRDPALVRHYETYVGRLLSTYRKMPAAAAMHQ